MTVQERTRVLLVDDQPARLLSYEAILDGLDLELVRATSGLEALKCLIQHEFAVILLDVNMPEMDGFETASLIHQHPRHERTPIIFVTGVHVTDLDRLKGYTLGAFDYVYVPVVPEILRTKVTVLAELHRRRLELQRVNAELNAANSRLAEANRLLHDEKTRELHALNQGLERANDELRRMMEELKTSDRRKDEFLAILGHELRNPLAPLHTAIEILRRPQLPEARHHELLSVIERQVLHLTRLVDDLLDLSRVTRDAMELRREVLDVAAVIDRAAELSRPYLDRAGQRLDIGIDTPALKVDGDAVRLAQVLANLLNNASKFSPPGATIHLHIAREGGDVNITVRDPGIGVPASMLERIFDPFIRVDRVGFGSHGGLGIGLALVKQIVTLHGGSVSALSDGADQGTEVRVRLPLSTRAQAASGIDPPVETVQPRCVLVADDNHDAADSLAVLLRLAGHTVHVVYSGEAAVARVREGDVDVALLDIGMPDVDGLAAAVQIRALPRGDRITLVALTGWGQDTDRAQTLAAGFDGHCVKPVTEAQLRVWLGHRRNHTPHAASVA